MSDQKSTPVYSRTRFWFNILLLILSVGAIFFISFAWNLTYEILITYILSTAFTSFIFSFLKYVMLTYTYTSSEDEMISIKIFIFILTTIISLVAIPIIFLILFPYIWPITTTGMVSGLAVSDLILYKVKLSKNCHKT